MRSSIRAAIADVAAVAAFAAVNAVALKQRRNVHSLLKLDLVSCCFYSEKQGCYGLSCPFLGYETSNKNETYNFS